jgi:hypothetical protein
MKSYHFMSDCRTLGGGGGGGGEASELRVKLQRSHRQRRHVLVVVHMGEGLRRGSHVELRAHVQGDERVVVRLVVGPVGVVRRRVGDVPGFRSKGSGNAKQVL